jgi:hypothetical protein
MAAFVHLTTQSSIIRIRRSGIRAAKGAPGVYAMPVVPDFHRSHQWLRELRRWKGGRSLLAVYFRVPGETPAAFGRYNRAHAKGTADEATAALMAVDDAGGFEVAILRAIGASEITSIRSLPQLTGWRYFPEAKGRKPFCTCDYCQKGLPFSRRLRE